MVTFLRDFYITTKQLYTLKKAVLMKNGWRYIVYKSQVSQNSKVISSAKSSKLLIRLYGMNFGSDLVKTKL